MAAEGSKVEEAATGKEASSQEAEGGYNQRVQAVLQRKVSSARRTASKGSRVERNDEPKSCERYLEWNSFMHAKAVLADAEKKKQEGIQGKWQFQSLFKEVLEQTKKVAT